MPADAGCRTTFPVVTVGATIYPDWVDRIYRTYRPGARSLSVRT